MKIIGKGHTLIIGAPSQLQGLLAEHLVVQELKAGCKVVRLLARGDDKAAIFRRMDAPGTQFGLVDEYKFTQALRGTLIVYDGATDACPLLPNDEWFTQRAPELLAADNNVLTVGHHGVQPGIDLDSFPADTLWKASANGWLIALEGLRPQPSVILHYQGSEPPSAIRWREVKLDILGRVIEPPPVIQPPAPLQSRHRRHGQRCEPSCPQSEKERRL